jgi:hypothetical protein
MGNAGIDTLHPLLAVKDPHIVSVGHSLLGQLMDGSSSFGWVVEDCEESMTWRKNEVRTAARNLGR